MKAKSIKKFTSLLLAFTMVCITFVTPVKAAEGDLSPIDAMLADIIANKATGQNQYTKEYNYDDGQPENWQFVQGSGSITKDSGKLTAQMNAVSTAIISESPYIVNGVLKSHFAYNSDNDRIAFVIKSNSLNKGIKIGYDVPNGDKGVWVIQAIDGAYITFDGPKLAMDTYYDIAIGFQGAKLVIALDNTVIYSNDSCSVLEPVKDAAGRVGLHKWFGNGTIKLDNLSINGVGYAVDPATQAIEYRQDYEAANYTPNWTGGAPVIVNVDGNKMLKLTGTGRVYDNDSVSIQDGTLSLDYKVKAASRFGFRFRATDTTFSELNYDGTGWVWESNSGWSSKLDIPTPNVNQWYNIMLSFQGKSVKLYIDKELYLDTTFNDFSTTAGKFGIRNWGSGNEIYLDNILYTSDILEPEKILSYTNNYTDGITGTWIGATSAIVTEGDNKLLSLSGINGEAVLTDSPRVNKGTLQFKVKSSTANIGATFAEGSNVHYNGTNWVLKVNSNETIFTNAQDKIIANKWNHLGVKTFGQTVELFVNGKSQGTVTDSGTNFTTGNIGVYTKGAASLFIDDLNFTEKNVEVVAEAVSERSEYYEYFETNSTPSWTGLGSTSISEGYLKGTIAANTVAVNNDTVSMNNGAYQVKLISDKQNIGIYFASTKVYNNNGTWFYQEGTETAVKFAENAPIAANEVAIIRAEIVGRDVVVKLNNKTIGSFTLKGHAEASEFGVYNAATTVMNVKIDSMTEKQIFAYYQDYNDPSYTPNWVSSTTGATAVMQNNKLLTNLPGVTTILDKNTPMMSDLNAKFNFSTNVSDAWPSTESSGRYGFILRGINEQNFVAIVCDVNGNWMVKDGAGKDIGQFSKNYSLAANTEYTFNVSLVGTDVSFTITESTGNVVDMGSVSSSAIPTAAGKFGLRGWYGSKTITIDDLNITEVSNLPEESIPVKETSIASSKVTVTLDEAFPRIINYTLNGKTMLGQQEPIYSVVINSKKYNPNVTYSKVSTDKVKYVLDIPEIGVSLTVEVSAEGNVVNYKVTDIKETADTLVRTVGFTNNNLLYANTTMTNASYAHARSDGQWHGIYEEIVDDMKTMERAGDTGAQIAMISSNGLAASLENNVMSGGNKFLVEKVKTDLVNKVSIENGSFTYRHAQVNDSTEELPWTKIVLAEDENSDNKVDWQDGAVAYRDIMTKVYNQDQIKNSMMYISFNFASMANDPALSALDTGKKLYNFTDGFGQMILSKGYQAEGHDDSMPSYDHIGVRQGGAEDFNYLINEGSKYNLHVGVHLNATEYPLDSFGLNYNNLNGSASGSLSQGWTWIDNTYYVDQTKDVLSGELARRIKAFKDVAPGLNFIYVDVYTGNNYNAYKLSDIMKENNVLVGTEFAGPIEPGVAFTHWGTDLGYPNQGNKSKLFRFVKNDLDIFVGNALVKGNKIPRLNTWGDRHPDFKEGVTTFYNEVVPTKYMQHYGILKMEEDRVQFEDGVLSQRNRTTGKIELSKNGNLIASWADTGTTTDSSERHNAESTLLIPWLWDINTNAKLGVNNGAKLYHWNPKGGTTTWTITNDFAGVQQFKLYELSSTDKKEIGTVEVIDGKVTLNAAAATGYVLYPVANASKPVVAAKWGEGSPVKDFGFNSKSVDAAGDAWAVDSEPNIVKVVEDQLTLAQNGSPWNNYLEVGSGSAVVKQNMSIGTAKDQLQPGNDYTVSVWSKVDQERKATLEVEIDGKRYNDYLTTYNERHNSSFKYLGTTYQRIRVQFHVPENAKNAEIRLMANGGTGKVLFDDIKVWKHLTVNSKLNDPAYVVYDDFENVSEGWGPFEYGYSGSRQTHMAEKDPRGVVANDVTGQHQTWVLDGLWALKVNEQGAGSGTQLLKTNEASLKLKANTQYELGMLYSNQPGCTYEVVVKSPTAGEVLREELAKAPNALNGQGTNGGKQYTGKFTTGSAQDYYVAIIKKQATAGVNFDNGLTLIIDNFYVKDLSVNLVDKTELNAAIDNAQAKYDAAVVGSGEGQYPQPAKDALLAAIAAAKAVKDDAEANQENVDTAAATLSTAVTTFENQVISAINKTALNTAIADAQVKYSAAVVGGAVGQYPKTAKYALLAAINVAKAVNQNSASTQINVDAALKALNNAMTTFDSSIIK